MARPSILPPLALAMACIWTGAAHAGQASLSALQDTYIESAQPTLIFSNQPNLLVLGSVPIQNESFLQFDLGSLGNHFFSPR